MKDKTTHTITQVEELMYDYHNRLCQAETVEERRAIIKKLKPLESHWRDVTNKHNNGKVYPERMKGFPDDVPMDKEAVLKLIESVETPEFEFGNEDKYSFSAYIEGDLDLQGGSPMKGENRFEYIDKGWPKAKEPKAGKLI